MQHNIHILIAQSFMVKCTELHLLSDIMEIIIPPHMCFISSIYRGEFLKSMQREILFTKILITKFILKLYFRKFCQFNIRREPTHV